MPRYGRRMEDAHSRQPRPKPKPLPKKNGGNAIKGFLGSAARVVKDFSVEAATAPAKETYKFFSPDAKRLWEYAGFTGPTGPMGGKYSGPFQATRKLGALSERQIADLLEKGEGILELPQSYRGLRHGKAVEKMFEGGPIQAGRYPRRPGSWGRMHLRNIDTVNEEGADFPHRLPFVTHERYGNPVHAWTQNVHGDLLREVGARERIATRGMRARTGRAVPRDAASMGSHRYPPGFNQGWVIEPVQGHPRVRLELGHGEWVGVPMPQDTRGQRAMLRHIFRDFDDDMVRGRLYDEPPGMSGGRRRPVSSRTRNAAMERFNATERFASEDAWVEELIRRDFAERQGKRTDRLFDALGGPMSAEELQRFASSEIRRRKRRKR